MTDIFTVFPGQGSQTVGMGKELYERYPLAKELFDRADAALGFKLSSICFEGPEDKLTMTEIAQPAILTVSTICFQLANLIGSATHTIVAAAGHSLGEYSALVAAGSLAFEDAVVLVNKRGSYMQEAVPVGAGKMVAVLGKEVSEIETALSKVTGEVASVANVNTPSQVVVAGSSAGIAQFIEAMGTAKIIELTVSAPFHCELMKPAEIKLRNDLATITIKEPAFPVYQNYTARPTTSPDEIRENLALQVCGRVRWVECFQNGITGQKPTAVWEFGAGAVLTGLAKRIDSSLVRTNVDSIDSIEKGLAA